MRSAQLSSQVFLRTVWLGACQLTPFSLTGWAEERLQRRSVSFLSVNLYSSSKTAVMSLLSSHTLSGKWALGVCFMPWRTFPIKRRGSAWGPPGTCQGFTLSACVILASDLRGRGGRGEKDPGTPWSFQVTALFPWVWIFKKERSQRKGWIWNENRQALLKDSFFSWALMKKIREKADETPKENFQSIFKGFKSQGNETCHSLPEIH